MAEISAKLVKQLRDKTNAGIMNCKKALVETNGDIDEAVKWLKEKGISDAAKKSDRETAEGAIAAVSSDDKKAAVLVEINCETDFVARNTDFKKFVEDFAKKIINEENSTKESIESNFGEDIKAAVGKFGENITLGSVSKLSVDPGMVQQYIHGVGNIGVIASFKTGKQETIETDDFISMTMGIVMHIAAMSPDFLDKDSVSDEVIKEQKDILVTKAKETGKPDNVIEKMVEGQLNKFYAEICLIEQPYVKDQKKKVKDIIADTAKKVGDDIKLEKFIRLQVGE